MSLLRLVQSGPTDARSWCDGRWRITAASNLAEIISLLLFTKGKTDLPPASLQYTFIFLKQKTSWKKLCQQYQEKQQAETDKEKTEKEKAGPVHFEKTIVSNGSDGPVVEKIRRKTVTE